MHELSISAASVARTCRRAHPRASQPACRCAAQYTMHVHNGSSQLGWRAHATNPSIPGRCSVTTQKANQSQGNMGVARVRADCCGASSNLPTKGAPRKPQQQRTRAYLPNGRSVIDYDSSRSSRSNILQPRSCGGLKGLIEIIKVFPPPASSVKVSRGRKESVISAGRCVLLSCTSCR